MAKFSGEIGYGETVEKPPNSGVWEDEITERKYFGDLVTTATSMENGISVNDDISVRNSISIVADPFANEHIFAMRYVRWRGELWKVISAEVAHPRILLRLGGVYHGPTAESSS